MTSATGYADRALVITPDSVVFSAGAEGSAAHPLQGVQLRGSASGTLVVTLEYGQPYEVPSTLILQYHVEQQYLELNHMKDVLWTRSHTETFAPGAP